MIFPVAKGVFLAACVVAVFIGGCASDERVILNQRAFDVGSDGSLVLADAAGCSVFDLGSSKTLHTTSGVADLLVNQELDGESVQVAVTQGHAVVASRTYSPDFFSAEIIDDVHADTNEGKMVVRFWGQVAPDGLPDCPDFARPEP